jgi:hypothetical protein
MDADLMTTNTKQMGKGGFNADFPDEHINIDLRSFGEIRVKTFRVPADTTRLRRTLAHTYPRLSAFICG